MITRKYKKTNKNRKKKEQAKRKKSKSRHRHKNHQRQKGQSNIWTRKHKQGVKKNLQKGHPKIYFKNYTSPLLWFFLPERSLVLRAASSSPILTTTLSTVLLLVKGTMSGDSSFLNSTQSQAIRLWY
jgi:hypothetical protein